MMKKYPRRWSVMEAKAELDICLRHGLTPSKQTLILAAKALEKQIPAQVTHEATLLNCCTCPSCKNVVDEFEKFVPGQKTRVLSSTCRFCGQALKWGY